MQIRLKLKNIYANQQNTYEHWLRTAGAYCECWQGQAAWWILSYGWWVPWCITLHFIRSRSRGGGGGTMGALSPPLVNVETLVIKRWLPPVAPYISCFLPPPPPPSENPGSATVYFGNFITPPSPGLMYRKKNRHLYKTYPSPTVNQFRAVTILLWHILVNLFVHYQTFL